MQAERWGQFEVAAAGRTDGNPYYSAGTACYVWALQEQTLPLAGRSD